MSLFTFLSAKGSPGVTTAVVGIAANWPTNRDVVIAEFDPSGGDLAHRFGLTVEVSTVSLAASSRRETPVLEDHCQSLPGDLRALVGPIGTEQATAALAMLAQSPTLNDAFGKFDVLADCGRLDRGSPSLPFLGRSDVTIIVTRPAVSDVAHVGAFLPLIRKSARQTALLVTGRGRYDAAEVAQVLELPLLGVLPHDESGAQILSGERGTKRALGRSALLRACGQVASNLADMAFEAEEVAS